MRDAAPLERLLRRDALVVSSAIALITILAWWYVVMLATGMDMGGMDMSGMRMASTGFRMVMAPAAAEWTAAEFVLMFAMWGVMMVGMMTPSAAPLLLLYARVGRQASIEGTPFAATGWCAAGYLFAWAAFALAATSAQWALESVALLSWDMATSNPALGGAVLAAAGLYQWSPLKHACLTECRSPLAFIHRQGGFRRDIPGAFMLGVRHGTYCVGCCWSLMLLLFVGGVMNLLWIAGLSILVLLEKVTPVGSLVARVSGAILLAAGVGLLLSSRN